MQSFYLQLWLRWTGRVLACSVILAAILSLLITFGMYAMRGFVELNDEVISALVDIAIFWFPIVWSFTLLLALFRSLKYIFNICLGGHKLQLLTCGKEAEVIEEIGYGDLVKVWRKWFMLLIWLVGSMMVLALIFTNLFTNYSGIFEWFDIYWLIGFVLASGYFSFIILSSRCKKVKVVRC